MNGLKRIPLLVALVLVAGATFSTPASAGVSFDFFYSNLSGDGSRLYRFSGRFIEQVSIWVSITLGL